MIGALLVATHAASADPCHSKLTFAPGRAALTPSTKHTLDPLRAQLRKSPQLHVQIVAADDPLAARRAEAAKWYLVDGGVEVDRIATSTAATLHDELHVRVVGGTCSAMAPAPKPSPGLVATKPPSEPPSSASMVDDASELASLLAGSDEPPPTPLSVPHATARTEMSELPPPPVVHIGHDDVGFRGSEIALHVVTVPVALRLASTTLATSTPHHEETIERASLEDGANDTAEVEGNEVKLEPKQLRPLARCYRRALGLDPSISNRANLSFGIDKKGHVTAPVAISDTDQLDTCLHAAMKKWQFPPGKAMASTWMTVTLRAR
jgi:hypothetical protein